MELQATLEELEVIESHATAILDELATMREVLSEIISDGGCITYAAAAETR